MTRVELIFNKPNCSLIIKNLLLLIKTNVVIQKTDNSIFVISEKPEVEIIKIIQFFMDKYEEPLSYKIIKKREDSDGREIP